LNIFTPKWVKGICRGRSKLGKSEAYHILNNVGETSQKGSKECEVEANDSESSMQKKERGVIDKKLDDANR